MSTPCRWQAAAVWRRHLGAVPPFLPVAAGCLHAAQQQQQQQQPRSQQQQPRSQQQQQRCSCSAAPAAGAAAAAGSGSGGGESSSGKEPSKHMHMSQPMVDYLLQHNREPPVLAELRAATAQAFPAAARMAISPDQAAFLAWLLRTLGAARVIEVGVFAGYSSTAMALALPPHGRLVACDRDPKAMALAREFWHKAGVADKVDERLAPAAATLDELLADPAQHGSYDFAFIDADKKGYRAYYEQALRLVRRGGVVAIDNVLWYGRVADGCSSDGATLALRELNDFLVADQRVAFSLVAVGDGMALCTKL